MALFFDRRKERKLLQWTVTYLAGAWAFMEASSLVVEQFHRPEVVGQGITIVAVLGSGTAEVPIPPSGMPEED